MTPAANVTSVQGFGAVLDCVATGDPQPVVTWLFGGTLVPTSPRVQQSPNNSLTLSPVQVGDRGEYVCRASNPACNAMATRQLTVYGKREGNRSCGKTHDLAYFDLV